MLTVRVAVQLTVYVTRGNRPRTIRIPQGHRASCPIERTNTRRALRRHTPSQLARSWTNSNQLYYP